MRTKKPDRGVYQPPILTPVTVESLADLVRDQDPEAPKRTRRELVDVGLESAGGSESTRRAKSRLTQARGHEKPILDDAPTLNQVGHDDVVLVQPVPPGVINAESIVHPGDASADSGEPWGDAWSDKDVPRVDDGVIYHQDNFIHDATCDGCDSCGMGGCDSIGCDSMGSSECPWYRSWANSSLCLDGDHWFGNVEVLLMWRRGDRLPALVTTSTDTDPDTAGELGQANTQVLVGNDSILKDVVAGGRFTVGTWIDNQKCRSMVLRGWFAGEETFAFNANQDQIPVIARPFLNVSDNQAAEQDTQLIAFPDRAAGSIDVRAKSDVFGGDFSVRQMWYSKYGGTVDVLYGYQYMRLTEDLSISSSSTSLDDNFAPLGSVISVADAFDTENDFHGAQLGLASRYREGCWSFHSLAKVAFGSLRRHAELSGATRTTIDGASAVDPNGLLVRSTNAGEQTDHTFGWVPEIDLSLGWQRYPLFDVTIGYHVIAMTDALQVSGAIDPNLAVNLSDPPTGQQRPQAALTYRTYYVQGIHFGLQYVY